MGELISFDQQVDDQLRLSVVVQESPQLINLISYVKDIYEDNLYASRFLYDFFFKRILKESGNGRGRLHSYRQSLMEINGVPATRLIN